MKDIVLIIPAYNPPHNFIALLTSFQNAGFSKVVVVDDGSDKEYEEVFADISQRNGVTLLKHVINMGKGAALKTAFNYCCCTWPDIIGAITADADGQHLPADAKRLANELELQPEHLILGTRHFGNKVPWRSKIGNQLTRLLFRGLIGFSLRDTQTGLRGVPGKIMKDLLRLRANGYEFELDMLLMCRKLGITIRQIPVETIYINSNRSSHFNPLIDSMRIYFVLLRFSLASASTALIDYTIFFMSFTFGGSLATSQIVARLFALFYNYTVVKKLVFFSDDEHQKAFPKYVALVIVSGLVSYQMIISIQSNLGWSVVSSKIVAEMLIFLANFTIQRDFIFTRKRTIKKKTDWSFYYSRPFAASSLTRQWTSKRLCHLISRFVVNPEKSIRIAELGGGGGSFVPEIQDRFNPSLYDVYDNNEQGLIAAKQKIGMRCVNMKESDILSLSGPAIYDLVYSVGLIEHFDKEGTNKAIHTHLNLLCPGGVAIITFPTPTWIYNAIRFIAEFLGLWHFHDERPLRFEEVRKAIGDQAEEKYATINWGAVLTQGILVVQKPKV